MKILIVLAALVMSVAAFAQFTTPIQGSYTLDGRAVTISKKPAILAKFCAANLSFTFMAHVYSNASDDSTCIREHEFTHVRQQRAYAGGAWAWTWRYLTSGTFRQSQEFEAYTVQAHEIGILWGKTSTQYTQFEAEVGDITGHTAAQVATPMAGVLFACGLAFRAGIG